MAEPIHDLIGREEFVGKVCALVDGLAVDQHICIAIDGAWGSGKTFVLQMIEEKLKTHDEYFIIRYDAWANSFYDDPLIAILSCIIDELQKRLPIAERLKSVGKELASSLRISLPIPLLVPKEYKEEINVLKKTIKTLKKLIRAFKQPFSKDTSQKKVGEFKSYLSLLAEVKQKLSLVVKAKTKPGKQGKLVFLVDEIDRCLPNDQLKILERMHHLLNIPNCAVICALYCDSIFKKEPTASGIDGKEYLKKFFDYTYRLETKADIYCKYLFDLFEERGRKENSSGINWEEEPIKQAYQCLKYGSKTVFSKIDNRSIDRYFDSLFKACDEYGWDKLDEKVVFFIIVALFIRKNISRSFLSSEEIISHPPEENRSIQDLRDDPMPYFDYLKEYIGYDLNKEPSSIIPYGKQMKLSGFSKNFSNRVAHSVNKKMDQVLIELSHYPYASSDPEYVTIRELIIRYGGEIQQ